MTVPNLITTIRIILAPVFIIYLINDQFFSALIVFVICTLSDGLDGMVARLYGIRGVPTHCLVSRDGMILCYACRNVEGIIGMLFDNRDEK